MAFVKYIDSAYGLHSEFNAWGRPYFSIEACQELIDYYAEWGEDIELDVIALCCDWTEYEPDELRHEFTNVLTFEEWCIDEGLIENEGDDLDGLDDYYYDFIEALAEAISQSTTIFTLDNGCYLVGSF